MTTRKHLYIALGIVTIGTAALFYILHKYDTDPSWKSTRTNSKSSADEEKEWYNFAQ